MGTIDDLLAGLDPEDRVSVERIYSVARDELAAWTIADGAIEALELG